MMVIIIEYAVWLIWCLITLKAVRAFTCTCAKSLQSCSTLCDPMDDSLPGLLCPWDSPGKNTGVGRCALLQGIFLTQGSNLRLLHPLHWQVGSLPPSQQGRSPISLLAVLHFSKHLHVIFWLKKFKTCFKSNVKLRHEYVLFGALFWNHALSFGIPDGKIPGL